jgi:23S rRNA (guanosine2251-2'-O)-methyltransferase
MAANRTYLYGKNSILERIRYNPKSIKNVFVQENFNNPRIISLLKSNSIQYRMVREKEMLRIKRADRLQGIVAEVDRFAYTSLEQLLGNEAGHRPCFLILDDINDPHNLGSIIRITACFGDFAIVLPRHASCEVNDTVMHVASGGENFTPVVRVSNTLNAVLKIKKAGYWIAGTVVENGRDIKNTDIPFPVAIILGSEGSGIKQSVLKHVDINLTLEMAGAPLSFNVAMAASIFCYEIKRQLNATTKES